MATLVDVTGAAYPAERNGHKVQPMAGVSLRPAFAGQPLNRQDPIVFEHEGNRAVRDGKWKLVALNKQPWELYDLEADRTEANDLGAKHTGSWSIRLGTPTTRTRGGRTSSRGRSNRAQGAAKRRRRPPPDEHSPG
jgi:hypothetical protein